MTEQHGKLATKWLPTDPDGRALRQPLAVGDQVERQVRTIIERVRRDGDRALVELVRELDGVDIPIGGFTVPKEELERALAECPRELLEALQLAARNVQVVAAPSAPREPRIISLPQGQVVEVRELPVARAGLYVPGGRAAYPSTVVMEVAAARAAGVEELVVCVPPGSDGQPARATLAACALLGVHEVWRIGGAQAIAALAFGTESLRPVDFVAGPGNRWVQEAKRQVFGQVGIDGLQGPSELVVLASEDADPELAAADLLAQIEHGPGGLAVAVSPSWSWLEEVAEAANALAARLGIAADTPLLLGPVSDLERGLALCEQIAPEHLQLVGTACEALRGRVRNAGCVFVGRNSGAAFGDYVAGSNHVLPTGGAARFQGALSAAAFLRRVAHVWIPDEALDELAAAAVTIAREEGLRAHAHSIEVRRAASPTTASSGEGG